MLFESIAYFILGKQSHRLSMYVNMIKTITQKIVIHVEKRLRCTCITAYPHADVGDPFKLTLLIWLAYFGLGSFDDFLFGKKVRGLMWLPLINLCRCGPVDGVAER